MNTEQEIKVIEALVDARSEQVDDVARVSYDTLIFQPCVQYFSGIIAFFYFFKRLKTAVICLVKCLNDLFFHGITSSQTSCNLKQVRYKIDLLPAEIRKQVDNMLCSGKYTSKEVSKYIQEQTGLYISYVTLCNYKKTHFILVEDDVQLTLF